MTMLFATIAQAGCQSIVAPADQVAALAIAVYALAAAASLLAARRIPR